MTGKKKQKQNSFIITWKLHREKKSGKELLSLVIKIAENWSKNFRYYHKSISNLSMAVM